MIEMGMNRLCSIQFVDSQFESVDELIESKQQV